MESEGQKTSGSGKWEHYQEHAVYSVHVPLTHGSIEKQSALKVGTAQMGIHLIIDRNRLPQT